MAKAKGLKPKDIERLNVLFARHPGDLTEQERLEKEALQDRYAKEGLFGA